MYGQEIFDNMISNGTNLILHLVERLIVKGHSQNINFQVSETEMQIRNEFSRGYQLIDNRDHESCGIFPSTFDQQY